MNRSSRPSPETVTHSLALVATAGLGVLLSAHPRVPEFKDSPAPAMQIALETEPAPSPVPPAPPAPEPPRPQPVKTVRPPPHHDAPQPVAAPLMAADLAPSTVQTPSESSDGPLGSPVHVPAAQAPHAGDLESQYAATLRTNIDSRTSVPTSAEYRLTKPHGEVRVNFTLVRSGMLVSAELARSSGSTLLDRHALEIVRTGQYPPFPSDAFQGESRHSFLITLEFHS